METITFDSDIKVFYVTAISFPDGIMEAHQKLHELIPASPDRIIFGISRPENGQIVYRAAAEEIFQGEAERLHCETLILKKGNYISLTIHNFINDIQRIGHSFTELLSNPDIDPEGYCVELYLNEKDVKCMIRLKDE